MKRLWQRREDSVRSSTSTKKRHPAKSLYLEHLETRELLAGNPLVSYHGGPLVQNAQVENLYFGTAWTSNAELQSTISQLDGYTQYLTSSPYFDVLKQYNIGHGSFVDHDIVNADPAAKTTVDDSQLRSLLKSEIASGHLKHPNSNSVYVLYTAPGVTVTAGGQSSARDFAGYHDSFRDSLGDTVYYAVIPYPTGNVVNAPLSALQQATLVASHELAEAVTDPDTQSGWFANGRNQGEIGDLAEGQFGLLHGYVVQDVWSNNDGRGVLPSDSVSSGVSVTGESVSAQAGKSFTSLVATFTSNTANPAATSFAASLDWGDGQKSTGTVTADPNGGFDVTGTHTYSRSGSFQITVAVLDKSGHTLGSVFSQATVASATSDKVIRAKGTRIDATAGTAFTGVVASFTSTTPSAQASNFTATIDWGDGTSSTGAVAVNSSGGFTVTGTHTYTSSNARGPRWGMPLGAFGLPGTPTSLLGDQFFVIQVSIHDQTANADGKALSLAHVQPAPPNINLSGVNIKTAAGQVFTGVVATFTDVHTDAQASQFTAAIDWGDGTTSVGTVAADPKGGFTVTGTHTYAEASRHGPIFNPFGLGTGNAYFILHVSVIDSTNNDAASSESLAAVAPAPPNISASVQNIQAVSGKEFSGVVATFTDLNTKPGVGDFSATIYWGDGTRSTGTVAVNPDGGFTVSGTHTYQLRVTPDLIWGGPSDKSSQISLGTASAILTVTIQDNTSHDRAEAHGVATVTPPPSSVTPAGVAFNAVVGQQFSGTVATFTAADANAKVGQFSATIHWGDGTTSDGTITANATGGFTVTGTHTYSDGDDSGETGIPEAAVFAYGIRPKSGGRYLVTVTINNSADNTSATAVSLADVTPTPPKLTATGQDVQATAGKTFSGIVATFTDADGGTNPNSYRASIFWGDGRSSDASVSVDANGGFDVNGKHTYAKGGTYTVYVSIRRRDGQSAVTFSKAVVADKTSPTALGTVDIAFTQSAEFYANVIRQFYQQYLTRTPGSPEVQYWVGAMQAGATDEQVMAGFIASAEYFNRAGGTNKAWVDALYRDLLNRGADAAGEAAWIHAAVNAGARASIAYGFAASDERHGLVIQSDYQQLLSRVAGQAEVGFWVGAFKAGATHEQILAGFVSSAEYYQKHNGNASDWLTSAYQNILQREPDQPGFDKWLGVLQALSH